MKDEFGLTDDDVPDYMRKNFDPAQKTDHIVMNIQCAGKFNDINKMLYFAKMKYNVVK